MGFAWLVCGIAKGVKRFVVPKESWLFLVARFYSLSLDDDDAR